MEPTKTQIQSQGNAERPHEEVQPFQSDPDAFIKRWFVFWNAGIIAFGAVVLMLLFFISTD